jgi:uncharacterized protein (UPF0335 family)
MDFKKRLIEELKLSQFQADTMLSDYIEVCEKLAKEYHQLQEDIKSGKIKCDFEHHNADVRRAYTCSECGGRKLIEN